MLRCHGRVDASAGVRVKSFIKVLSHPKIFFLESQLRYAKSRILSDGFSITQAYEISAVP